MNPHVERPTRMLGGKTYCSCGSPWPCQRSDAAEISRLRNRVAELENALAERDGELAALKGAGS